MHTDRDVGQPCASVRSLPIYTLIHPCRFTAGVPKMKKIIAVLSLTLLALPAFAAKNCDELKAEIVTKLETKQVKNYTLDIIATEGVKDQKVVGSCAGGTKKIVYKRN
jgi:hypothetical protein